MPLWLRTATASRLLREPVTALNRADVAIITRTDRVSAEELQQIRQQIGSVNNDLPIIEFGHAIDGLKITVANWSTVNIFKVKGFGFWYRKSSGIQSTVRKRKYDIVCDIEFADPTIMIAQILRGFASGLRNIQPVP